MSTRAHSGAGRRVDARRVARERMLHRRRRVVVGIVLATAMVLVAVDVLHGGTSDPAPDRAASATHAAVPAGHRATPSSTPSPTSPTVTYPRDGGQQWETATGQSKVFGASGTLHRYQVQIETDIKGVDLQKFADTVDDILGDKQGWTAGGDVRLQRVGPGQEHDFILHLVTPGTRDKMCHDVPEAYTSCNWESDVVINVSRWVHSVPYYKTAGIAMYREYAVSHEVGHQLGHGHQLCPGTGTKAPTMMQQTLGMHGCLPQPWPYPEGSLYSGPDGDYSQDNIPTDPPSFYTH